MIIGRRIDSWGVDQMIEKFTSRSLTGAVIISISMVPAGCTGGGTPRPGELRGAPLDHVLPKPSFSLSSTAGHPYELVQNTDGFVTLLFFGYTNCPDVCPIHMANIAAVLHQLPPDVADQIKVVMVTTDPERDTPERLREWLDKFDPKFVGLRGSLDQVNEIQRRMGLPASVRSNSENDYLVGHAAQVIAFTKDDSAHVVYPFGTRQSDWAHDLPILVRSTGNKSAQ